MHFHYKQNLNFLYKKSRRLPCNVLHHPRVVSVYPTARLCSVYQDFPSSRQLVHQELQQSVVIICNDCKGWTHLQYMRTSQIHRSSGKEHYRNITQNFVMYVLSLERKVPLDSLMVVLTVVEAIQFPLEIPNPNASLFLDSSSQRWKTLPVSISPTIKGQSLSRAR